MKKLILHFNISNTILLHDPKEPNLSKEEIVNINTLHIYVFKY
jgi:hypothetical protein